MFSRIASTCAGLILPLADEPVERLLDLREALVDRVLLAVLEEHLVAALRRDLRDPAAHRAGSDHSENLRLARHR